MVVQCNIVWYAALQTYSIKHRAHRTHEQYVGETSLGVRFDTKHIFTLSGWQNEKWLEDGGFNTQTNAHTHAYSKKQMVWARIQTNDWKDTRAYLTKMDEIDFLAENLNRFKLEENRTEWNGENCYKTYEKLGNSSFYK